MNQNGTFGIEVMCGSCPGNLFLFLPHSYLVFSAVSATPSCEAGAPHLCPPAACCPLTYIPFYSLNKVSQWDSEQSKIKDFVLPCLFSQCLPMFNT